MGYLYALGTQDALYNAARTGHYAGYVGTAIQESTRELVTTLKSQTNAMRAQTNALEDIEVSLRGIESKMEEHHHNVLGALEAFEETISGDIRSLEATVKSEVAHVTNALGSINETLEELVEIVANPSKTAAYEHFVEARRCFKQGWVQEAADELVHRRPALDRQEVDALDQELRVPLGALPHHLDQLAQSGQEAVVSDAQQGPARHARADIHHGRVGLTHEV